MEEYIEKQKILDFCNSVVNKEFVGAFNAFAVYVNTLPTIDIVRCGECENFIPMTHGCKRSPSVEPWWEDDYCSYGEREGE